MIANNNKLPPKVAALETKHRFKIPQLKRRYGRPEYLLIDQAIEEIGKLLFPKSWGKGRRARLSPYYYKKGAGFFQRRLAKLKSGRVALRRERITVAPEKRDLYKRHWRKVSTARRRLHLALVAGALEGIVIRNTDSGKLTRIDRHDLNTDRFEDVSIIGGVAVLRNGKARVDPILIKQDIFEGAIHWLASPKAVFTTKVGHRKISPAELKVVANALYEEALRIRVTLSKPYVRDILEALLGADRVGETRFKREVWPTIQSLTKARPGGIEDIGGKPTQALIDLRDAHKDDFIKVLQKTFAKHALRTLTVPEKDKVTGRQTG